MMTDRVVQLPQPESSQRPPLVPVDCDLSGFTYMPVDVRRLLRSETWMMASPGERAAAVALWFESWEQKPPASLPINDRILAKLADTNQWPRVKAGALRGWILCADGRLYHPVVAEKVLEAWIAKLVSSISGGQGNAKRWGRAVDVHVEIDRLREASRLLQEIAPLSETLLNKRLRQILSGVDSTHPESGGDTPPESPPDTPPESGGDRNRTRTGTGERTLLSPIKTTSGAARPMDEADEPTATGQAPKIPDCPHLQILALWAEVLPQLPQHDPALWRGKRRDHLQARWRETAASKKWSDAERGLRYFRKFFGFIGESKFLTGQVPPQRGHAQFIAELAWIVNPENWAKVHEGKYHTDT